MKGKKWYWLGVGPIVIGGVFVWLWTQTSSEGTVRTGTTSNAEVVIEPALYRYQGEYTTFELPEIFQKVTETLPESGPVKETIFFVNSRGGNNEKIAVTVEEREEKTFEASPSYQMRKSNSQYVENKSVEKNERFLTKEQDPFELTYFFFLDEYLVSLSYTATTQNEERKIMFERVKNSIQKGAKPDVKKSPESLQ